jgi:hypothetical protein
MSLLGKVKAVFFGRSLVHAEDSINVEISRSLQRNEAASQRARNVLKEMLAENDRVKDGRNA